MATLIGSDSTREALTSINDAVANRPRTGQTLVNDNLDFITQLGQPSRMAAYLRAIAADENETTAIAARSYHHVNHFDKIVLVDSGDPLGYRLTLHIWSPPYTASALREELIHDHRFSFWSHILTGVLTSQYYTRAAGTAGVRYQQYRHVREQTGKATQSAFRESLKPVGDVQLVTAAPQHESAGQVYYLHYERIHRVLLPHESTTATVVLRGPREQKHSNVYDLGDPEQDLQRRSITFSAGELAAKLVRLAATIERTRLRGR